MYIHILNTVELGSTNILLLQATYSSPYKYLSFYPFTTNDSLHFKFDAAPCDVGRVKFHNNTYVIHT